MVNNILSSILAILLSSGVIQSSSQTNKSALANAKIPKASSKKQDVGQTRKVNRATATNRSKKLTKSKATTNKKQKSPKSNYNVIEDTIKKQIITETNTINTIAGKEIYIKAKGMRLLSYPSNIILPITTKSKPQLGEFIFKATNSGEGDAIFEGAIGKKAVYHIKVLDSAGIKSNQPNTEHKDSGDLYRLFISGQTNKAISYINANREGVWSSKRSIRIAKELLLSSARYNDMLLLLLNIPQRIKDNAVLIEAYNMCKSLYTKISDRDMMKILFKLKKIANGNIKAKIALALARLLIKHKKERYAIDILKSALDYKDVSAYTISKIKYSLAYGYEKIGDYKTAYNYYSDIINTSKNYKIINMARSRIDYIKSQYLDFR